MTANFSPPFTSEDYLAIRRAVWDAGHQDDWEWSQSIEPPKDSAAFACELIFVICNSGMKNTVARQIYERVLDAIADERPIREAFRHEGKARAMQMIWDGRRDLFAAYRITEDKVAFLRKIPWIGPITCYHAAKNFGVDCVKPDIHIQRLADFHGETPEAFCRRMQADSGDRLATVDVMLWRACAIGLIKTRELVKA